jgi:AcrR family transcriptional regulator
MKRLSRTERAEQTRAQVLGAAARLFRKQGFHRATVEQIADAAGFSTGVIYSQFGGKDGLFLALIEQHAEAFATRLREGIGGTTGPDALNTLWSLARSTRDADVPWGLAVIEFRIHAARNRALNRRYAALHEKTLGLAADVVATLARQAGLALDFAAEDFARFVAVLDTGGLLERQAEGPGSAFELSRRAAWLLLTESASAETQERAPASS